MDLVLRELGSLPTVASVAARALELTAPAGHRSAGAAEALRQAAGVIAADPALAARVLSLANAASPGSVGVVAEAVRRLGGEALRSAVLSTPTLPPPPSVAADREAWDALGFWRHCLAVALAARMLVERGRIPWDPEEAFTAGLLHDIGKLALATVLPKSHARAVASARLHNGALADCEKRLLGVDHLVVGRRLAQRWRLPSALESAIWLHHLPSEAIPPSVAAAPLVRVVIVADAIARARQVGISGSFCPAPCPEELLRGLGLTKAVVAEVGDRLAEAVAQHARLLGLDAIGAGELPAGALAEANEELGRLNERLRLRGQALAARARAFEHFSAFARSVGGQVELSDVLVRIAEAALAAGQAGQASDAAAIAYCLDEEGGSVLAVSCQEGREPAWKAVPLAGLSGGPALPDGPAAAGEAVRALLGADGPRGEWGGLDGWRHQVLSCGGRRVGGLLLSAGEADEACDLLAGGLGMALGLVLQCWRAQVLCEELAGASRELADRQQAIAESKTLAAVGDLAAGAAHELNNPLAVVSGRAQLMRERSRSEAQRRTWQTIVDQAQRISDIISDLMDFARPPEARPVEMAPREVLAKAAEAFSSSDHPKARSCRVDIDIGEDCPALRADRAQIHAVILELIANAAAAGPTSHVRLAARSDELTAAVLLSVQDDGPGMDEATAARACTPFFSAQAAGRRRGLGLPRAKRYVENNGGKIWIDSKPGRGTTVWIRLPGAPAAGPAREQEHAHE